jgi:hypothetical protein
VALRWPDGPARDQAKKFSRKTRRKSNDGTMPLPFRINATGQAKA